ncbi:hypothetical protein KY361_04630 [Candidatus Woesearchaeota archaeon]|nr:hypothetical protein [Candidatus Woesearchaeota archaeon]
MAKMEDIEKRLCLAMEHDAEEAIKALSAEKPNPRLAKDMLKLMLKADGLGKFILLRRESKEIGRERRVQIMDAMAKLFVKIESDINDALAMVNSKEYEGAIKKIRVIIREIMQELGWESQLEKA